MTVRSRLLEPSNLPMSVEGSTFFGGNVVFRETIIAGCKYAMATTKDKTKNNAVDGDAMNIVIEVVLE